MLFLVGLSYFISPRYVGSNHLNGLIEMNLMIAHNKPFLTEDQNMILIMPPDMLIFIFDSQWRELLL